MPEHTLAAKVLAYGLGADYLEQDVVATRDGHLVVLHDLYLDDVTDVAVRFPHRARPDGHYYVIDFELAELRCLRVMERRRPGSSSPRFPNRFVGELGGLTISTLEEELTLIEGLNRTMGRDVGIYPEIKNPAWHREHGMDLSARLLTTLNEFGYSTSNDRVFIQCFDATELRRLRFELGCAVRLVQLVGDEPQYARLLTPQGLASLATYADGLGPAYSQLAAVGHSGRPELKPLALWARDAGLAVHAYTFRADELPAYARTLEELIAFFMVEANVAGVFCDHPDVAVRVRGTLPKVQ